MPMISRIAIGVAALLLGGVALRLARRNRLHAAAAAWWLGGAALLLAFAVAPELLRWLAGAFGPELSSTAALVLALGFLALRGLWADMDRTRSELCLRRLVRRHAHLELRLREAEQALAAGGAPLPKRGRMTGALEGTGDVQSPLNC